MLSVNTKVKANIPNAPEDARTGIVLQTTVICGKAHYYIRWDNGGELWVPGDWVIEL